MKSRSPAQWSFASLWLLAAALWSAWGLDWLLGAGSIEEPRARLAANAIAALMVLGAARAVLRPLSRSCLAADLAKLRNPKLFADPLSDDDHWKLKRRWSQTIRTRPDAELGWTIPAIQSNPLGILRQADYEPQTENVVLCFGDSFMAGLTPFPHKIPDLLEEQLDGRTAYNYGVGGYGVGQMYLRFQQAEHGYNDPIIVVGILSRDLDRTILSVRGSPKPRFRLVDGELVVEKPSLTEDPDDWDAQNPPSIRSYLLALLVRRARTSLARGQVEEQSYRREEKRVLNRAILGAWVEEARAKDLRLLFMTFPPSRNLGQPSWRDDFFEETFESLDVPWIDGRKVLYRDMKASGRKAARYFLPDNHPNELGNRLFAEALAARIEQLWGPPVK